MVSPVVTHFCQFTDQATAKAALPDYLVNSNWRGDIVDADIPVKNPDGSLASGYFLNIALPELDLTLPGLTGAGYRQDKDTWVSLYGAKPAGEPQREFEA